MGWAMTDQSLPPTRCSSRTSATPPDSNGTLVPARESLPRMSAEDRPASEQASAPREQDGASAQAVCLRQTPAQATSAVAHVAPVPGDDDPLLAFAPYLHAAPRRNSITPDLQRRFVATLAATGIVRQAAKSIGKSVEALYVLRGKAGAQGFAAAWDAALERGVQRLEDCALERALQGTPTPIVSAGKVLGTWDKPDNNLLRFLLQHRLAERYGTRKLVPGHPVYESIRAEVLAQEQAAAEAARPARPTPAQEEAERRARAIAMYGYDPEEGEPEEEDEGWEEDWDEGMSGEDGEDDAGKVDAGDRASSDWSFP